MKQSFKAKGFVINAKVKRALKSGGVSVKKLINRISWFCKFPQKFSRYEKGTGNNLAGTGSHIHRESKENRIKNVEVSPGINVMVS